MFHTGKTLGYLAALLLLAACGGQQYSPYGGTEEPTVVKIGKPYKIAQQQYKPRYDPVYYEEGMASWYGPGFHGRKTANGERFDEEELTAAHRTLPMPSLVRVTRTDNGRSVVVRVNDRGPFAHNRIIDLSKASARKLGMLKEGVARVRVEFLPEKTDRYISGLGLSFPKGWTSPYATVAKEATAVQPVQVSDAQSADAPRADIRITPAATASKKQPEAPQFHFSLVKSAHASATSTEVLPATAYRIQTGSFSSAENAERQADKMAAIASPEVQEIWVSGRKLYRVLLGPVYDVTAARQIVSQAQAMGLHDARIIVE